MCSGHGLCDNGHCVYVNACFSTQFTHLKSLFLHRCKSFLTFCFLRCSHRCDKGYGGAHCVPLAPLPSVLREDFNENVQQETWPEVYGAERGTLSGEPLKSGTALIFKGVGILNTMQRRASWIKQIQLELFRSLTLELTNNKLVCLQDGLRMIVSRDLDCTSTLYIQFSFKFITKGTAKLTFIATFL